MKIYLLVFFIIAILLTLNPFLYAQNGKIYGKLKFGTIPVINAEIYLYIGKDELKTTTSKDGSFKFDYKPIDLDVKIEPKGKEKFDVERIGIDKWKISILKDKTKWYDFVDHFFKYFGWLIGLIVGAAITLSITFFRDQREKKKKNVFFRTLRLTPLREKLIEMITKINKLVDENDFYTENVAKYQSQTHEIAKEMEQILNKYEVNLMNFDLEGMTLLRNYTRGTQLLSRYFGQSNHNHNTDLETFFTNNKTRPIDIICLFDYIEELVT